MTQRWTNIRVPEELAARLATMSLDSIGEYTPLHRVISRVLDAWEASQRPRKTRKSSTDKGAKHAHP